MRFFLAAIFFLLMLSESFAITTCGDRIMLTIAVDSTCAHSPAPTCMVPPGCSSAVLKDNLGCVAVCTVCCENPISTEQTVYGSNTIVDVPFGTEDQAASLALQSWLASASTPVCPEGYRKTGENTGAAYESFLAANSSNSEVDIDYWVRAACTSESSGSSIPLGDLTGGSGGSGGLTQAETAAAVTTGVSALDSQLQALNSKIDSTNQLLTSIDSKTGSGGSGVDYGLMSGSVTSGVNNSVLSSKLDQLITNTTGGITGGLTQAQTTAAVQAGLDNSAGVTPNSLGMDSYAKPGVYSSTEFSSFGSFDFGSRINTFVADVKTAPLFSSFTLSGLADTPAGVSAMPVSLGSFGVANFDFATYAGVYNYIKGFLLLLGSYLAVRIVVLKR